MTYLIVFILFCLLALVYRDMNNNKKSRVKFCFVASLIIFLLLLLRNDYVGTDTQNYHFLYDRILLPGYYVGLENAKISSEIGFYFLLYVMQTYTFDFRILLAISALLYISAVSFIIYKYSENPFFSYFLFFVNGFFIFNTTMRNCFALSFFIFAVYFAINRKLIPYLIFIALAVSFHSSALILFPIYWILKLKIDKRLIIIAISCFFLIFFLSKNFMIYSLEIFGKDYSELETGGVFRFLINIVIAIIAIHYRDNMDSKNRYWILLLLLSLVISPIAWLNPAFFRILIYFNFFLILLIPNMSSIKTVTTQCLMIFLICFGLLQFTYLSNKSGIRVFPYVFYWENYEEENPGVITTDKMYY